MATSKDYAGVIEKRFVLPSPSFHLLYGFTARQAGRSTFFITRSVGNFFDDYEWDYNFAGIYYLMDFD